MPRQVAVAVAPDEAQHFRRDRCRSPLRPALSAKAAKAWNTAMACCIFAVLPTRRVYVLDPKTWQVQTMWQVAGARSHGVGWEGDTLWVADSNLRAFFWHDMKTGEIVEKIQLTEKDPLIHGVTVHDGYLWYCDDVGYICNLKL